MEKPHANIEPPVDEYDHELTQVQANAIALADELLKHRPERSRIAFVDMVLVGDQHEMLVELQSGPLSHLLAAPNEQLAIESDGSYYSQLDVRKANGKFTGMSLRVWGWDYDKVRYTKPCEVGPPYEDKEYPGEKDKSRQIEIRMGYVVGDESVTEELSVHANSSSPNYIYASTQLSMPTYAEMGYEGHGGKSDYDISDEAVEWFLEFVAKNVGAEPKSHRELISEKTAKIRAAAEVQGIREAIDELIDGTWDAQALYIMRRPLRSLDGKSILECFETRELAAQVAEAAREILRKWKDGTWGECFVTSGETDEDE